MASEQRRGCGFRKVGGTYLVCGPTSEPCGRLPIELHICPVCNAGIKQTRGWTWVKPKQLLANAPYCALMTVASACAACPLSPLNLPEQAGLLWIGERFYATGRDFMDEAATLGVSRRIKTVPRNFKLGETWVLMGHPKAVLRAPRTPEELKQWAGEHDGRQGATTGMLIAVPGIVTMFKPTAVEKIVTESQMKDTAAMDALREKGLTPVAVPDDDPDHQGSVFEESDQMELS